MRTAFFFSLDLPIAVGGADFYSIVAGPRLPVVDVLAPGINVELSGELRVVPGLAFVGGDLDAINAAMGSPGDTADRNGTGREVTPILHGIDTGLGHNRALLRPGSLDPVGIEVPVGEFYFGEPLGGRDVAIEARDDETDWIAVFEG